MSRPSTSSEATPTAVLVVALAFILNFFGRGVADGFGAFLLPLEHEFGWNRPQLTGVFATAMLVTGIAAPLTGVLFDRFGPRLVYCCGLAFLGGGALLSARAQTLLQLYLSSGVMIGTGVALLGMVGAAALISRWYRQRLATAIAIAYAGFGSGSLILLPVIQHLIERDGWRSAYAAVGWFVLALLPLCALLPWRRLARGRPVAAVVGRPAQASRAQASSTSTSTSTSSANPAASPPSSDAAPAARPRDPDTTLGMALRSRAFWRLVQVLGFTSVAIYAVVPQIVAFLIESGFSSMTAATAFGLAGLLSTIGMIASGWLSDRIGFDRTALLSFSCTALGLLALEMMSFRASTIVLVLYVAFFGIGQGARGPIVSMLSNRIFTGRHAATIYGAVYASMAVGGAVGSLMGGVLREFAGYRPVFVFSLLALALAAEPFRRRSSLVSAGRAAADATD